MYTTQRSTCTPELHYTCINAGQDAAAPSPTEAAQNTKHTSDLLRRFKELTVKETKDASCMDQSEIDLRVCLAPFSPISFWTAPRPVNSFTTWSALEHLAVIFCTRVVCVEFTDSTIATHLVSCVDNVVWYLSTLLMSKVYLDHVFMTANLGQPCQSSAAKYLTDVICVLAICLDSNLD